MLRFGLIAAAIVLLLASCKKPEPKEEKASAPPSPSWNGQSMMMNWVRELELDNHKLTCKQNGKIAIYCTLAYDDKAGRRVLQDVICVKDRICHLKYYTE